MILDCCTLLKTGLASLVPVAWASAARMAGAPVPDHALRIATGLVELSSDHIVSTMLGPFPAPLLRLKEGQRVNIPIHNNTDTPELVLWHGQKVPSDIDGAWEEGAPFIPPHGVRQISLVPQPAGFRSGVLILGDLADDDRGHGMGMVVEYAGQKRMPQWVKPPPFRWDYKRFGKPGAHAPARVRPR